MKPVEAHPGPAAPTSGGAPAPGDELLVARAGPWRLLVPMRLVARVHSAAMPAARPGLAAAGPPVVAIDGAQWPVVFAAGLLGAAEVRLAASDQMIALAEGGRRALLWVDAVEDVTQHGPAPEGAAPAPGTLVVAHSGPRALAVLDVPRVLALADPAGAPGAP
jgi:hypothetical protein